MDGRWRFLVLHSNLASESFSEECFEAVITQDLFPHPRLRKEVLQQGRNGKDFIDWFRMSRKMLRSQVLWVFWVTGLPWLSSCAWVQGGCSRLANMFQTEKVCFDVFSGTSRCVHIAAFLHLLSPSSLKMTGFFF